MRRNRRLWVTVPSREILQAPVTREIFKPGGLIHRLGGARRRSTDGKQGTPERASADWAMTDEAFAEGPFRRLSTFS
ncbi:hypothetical protein [Sphingomonas sp. S2-65]|uniref:hypothetical protein n=1 Tax=Sphingomonas sp. S2-65 TaxID=2903960 RepID=UPI001F27F796|nr:hypothetical protein [Sphingomonas sp. S2-65]UYY57038.1 hypothetical protein LZ586_10100 [Sphingomonas sp. S2-65]